MNILLVSDSLTRESLLRMDAFSIRHSVLRNVYWAGGGREINFLLVESAWQGYKNRWKYKIASYPDVPKRNNHALRRLVERAKDKGIPTVFWNKEDGVHFDRFINSAKLFDHVFTVDENCMLK